MNNIASERIIMRQCTYNGLFSVTLNGSTCSRLAGQNQTGPCVTQIRKGYHSANLTFLREAGRPNLVSAIPAAIKLHTYKKEII
jgi:hypothetical protein